jgi:hypothetical protein
LIGLVRIGDVVVPDNLTAVRFEELVDTFDLTLESHMGGGL